MHLKNRFKTTSIDITKGVVILFSSFFKYLYLYFLVIFLLIIFIFIIYIYSNILPISSDDEYIWPLPGYTYISSYFGYRDSPTIGASSYHSGIDIPAPEGTEILSICDGTVTFASWGAGGGYTIVVEKDNIKVSYCHVSPNFIVFKNDTVVSGQIISNVGPKNVYSISNNPYYDSYGNPTNGATTGCHLHLTIKKDGIAVNPLEYFNLSN